MVGVAYAYFFVPETKGLKLEEVDRMMESCKPSRSAGRTTGEVRGDMLEWSKEEMGMGMGLTSTHVSRGSFVSRS